MAHLNAFTVGLVFPLLKTMGVRDDSPVVQDCLAAAEASLTAGGVHLANYPPNGYLSYYLLKGFACYAEDRVVDAGRATIEWAEKELYRQLALFSSGSDDNSDVYQLAYCLLLVRRFGPQKMPTPVVTLALDTIFGAQLPRGLFEKRDPLFVYGEHGDAHCFTFELLTAILEDFTTASDLLWKYQKNLQAAYEWAARNRHVGSNESSLWRSGHVVHNQEPESWVTAEVYLFLNLFRNFLSERLEALARRCFKGHPRSPAMPMDQFHLYQAEVTLSGSGQRNLLDLLEERLVRPLRVGGPGGRQYSLVYHPYPERCARSGILFGPPGTGKTTYVKTVARMLGWPLISLDPSDFAESGLGMISRRTAEIFEQLVEMEDTVIFFDEMEELIRQRRPEGSSGVSGASEAVPFEQKFLTTTFLPKLQDLHDRATSIFFIATNFVRALDSAAMREGRFDFQLQVLPPSLAEKRRLIREATELRKSKQETILEELKEEEQKARWATYLEMRLLIRNLSRPKVRTRSLLRSFEPRLAVDGFREAKRHEQESELSRFDLYYSP